MTDNKIIISGGQLQIKDYPIALVSKDYPGSESRVENWMNEFNLLVLFCDARFLREQRDMLAIIRNTMHFQNRSSEVILFLTHIDDVMNITPMDTELQTLLGIYSAFSSEPFSTTALKDEFSDCTLDSSYWQDQQFSRYQDNNRNVHFQMPRGVICNTSHSFGYCDLLMTIIRCCLSLRHIKFNHPIGFHIQTNHNNQLKNSSMSCLNRLFGKEETIRLAVIGDTSSGKTFLLQDFCQSLSFLGFNDTRRDFFPFSSHNDFRRDILNVGYGQTPNYACTQRNHYVTEYKKSDDVVRIEFLDIPGDIFDYTEGEIQKLNTCARFIQVLSGMKSKRRDGWFKVTSWEKGSLVIQVVSFIDNKDSTTTSNVENEGTANNQSAGGNNTSATTNPDVRGDSNNESKNGSDAINVRKPDYYSPDKHHEWLKNNGFKENASRVKIITGKELIDDFFTYDAHSIYNALQNAFDKFKGLVGVYSKQEYNDCLKSLYFFVYLYNATDIVFCQRCNTGVTRKIVSDNAESLSELVDRVPQIYRNNNNKRGPHYYLVFKGGDTFLKQDVVTSLYLDGYNLNHIYSYFTLELNNILYKKCSNHSFIGTEPSDSGKRHDKDERYYRGEDNYKKVIEAKLKVIQEEEVPKDFICQCIRYFVGVTPAPIGSITPHTYFCATPIDNNTFRVDSFNEVNSEKEVKREEAVKGNVTIDGLSRQPSRRVCFGTVQLTMDLLENHSIKFFLYNYDSKTGRGYTQPGTILRYLQKKQ